MMIALNPISLIVLYLCPDGDFNLKTWVEHRQKSSKVLIVVLEAMTEDQVADDVGDDVVEDEMRGEWFA